MRVTGLLLLVLLLVGALAWPTSAEPCPPHGHGGVHGAEAHDAWAPRGAGLAGQWATFETGTSASSWSLDRPGSHHSALDEHSCCHVTADTTVVTIGLAGDPPRMPQRRMHPAGWLRLHPSPAADIFHPPRLAS